MFRPLHSSDLYIAKRYGRFLPQDKAALAAQILNQVWEAA